MEANRWEEAITLSLLLWPIGEGTQTREREREKKSVGPNDDARRTSWKKRPFVLLFADVTRSSLSFPTVLSFLLRKINSPVFDHRVTSYPLGVITTFCWHARRRKKWIRVMPVISEHHRACCDKFACKDNRRSCSSVTTIGPIKSSAVYNSLTKISAEDDRSRTWIVCHALVCCGRWTN